MNYPQICVMLDSMKGRVYFDFSTISGGSAYSRYVTSLGNFFAIVDDGVYCT